MPTELYQRRGFINLVGRLGMAALGSYLFLPNFSYAQGTEESFELNINKRDVPGQFNYLGLSPGGKANFELRVRSDGQYFSKTDIFLNDPYMPVVDKFELIYTQSSLGTFINGRLFPEEAEFQYIVDSLLFPFPDSLHLPSNNEKYSFKFGYDGRLMTDIVITKEGNPEQKSVSVPADIKGSNVMDPASAFLYMLLHSKDKSEIHKINMVNQSAKILEKQMKVSNNGADIELEMDIEDILFNEVHVRANKNYEPLEVNFYGPLMSATFRDDM